MHLDISELFITLVFDNFCKECNLVVVIAVRADTVDDRSCPLNNERLDAILLDQESAHELLHSLDGQARLARFEVKLEFLVVHFVDDVLELLDWKDFAADAAVLSGRLRRLLLLLWYSAHSVLCKSLS